MQLALVSAIALMLVFPNVARAEGIGNPQPNSIQSGINGFTGFKCQAGILIARFDDGDPIDVSYGSERNDTISECGHAKTGFILLINWSVLGDGEHTVEVYDDGVLFDSVSFFVVTPGTEFLTGVDATVQVPNFPAPGQTATLEWNQANQSFVLVNVTSSATSSTILPTEIKPDVVSSAITGSEGVENPQPDSVQSGVNGLTGFKCQAGTITARFDDGDPLEVSYGSERNDTISECGHAKTGFILLINSEISRLLSETRFVERTDYSVVVQFPRFLLGGGGSCHSEAVGRRIFPAPAAKTRFFAVAQNDSLGSALPN